MKTSKEKFSKRRRERTVMGLFSGAGGLDLGFEMAGFKHISALDIEHWCVETMRHNRPQWHVIEGDVKGYDPSPSDKVDVLLAGFPCQGFSLGGSRDAADSRNSLYKEVVRISKKIKPCVVVIENVLNLRTMKNPATGKPFAEEIAAAFRRIGYHVSYQVFRVSHFGVPQTRRRFIFIASKSSFPEGFHFPTEGPETSIRNALFDLANGRQKRLPNHDPMWGFSSQVHVETGGAVSDADPVVPVRFSRTASDGNPIRSFDQPFPAVDTATVWGWAQGDVVAKRVEKDREKGKFIRNPNANVTLWRISACRLRTFTAREYARLQTFPDDWIFLGNNKRDVQLQIGNAVPVQFAKVIGEHVQDLLDAIDDERSFSETRSVGSAVQLSLI